MNFTFSVLERVTTRYNALERVKNLGWGLCLVPFYLGRKDMETIVAAALSAVAAIITCIVNNNIQRVREQAQIEAKIDSINANYDKQTALITQRIETLTEHVNQHNNLIDRMYNVEALTVRLQDMIDDLREDDRR